jgi:hypothetical protein
MTQASSSTDQARAGRRQSSGDYPAVGHSDHARRAGGGAALASAPSDPSQTELAGRARSRNWSVRQSLPSSLATPSASERSPRKARLTRRS